MVVEEDLVQVLVVITTGPIHVVEVVSSIVVMLVVMVAIVGLQVSCKINLNGSSSGSAATISNATTIITTAALLLHSLLQLSLLLEYE